MGVRFGLEHRLLEADLIRQLDQYFRFRLFRLLAQAHLDQRLLHVQARVARQGRMKFNLV